MDTLRWDLVVTEEMPLQAQQVQIADLPGMHHLQCKSKLYSKFQTGSVASCGAAALAKALTHVMHHCMCAHAHPKDATVVWHTRQKQAS